MKDLRSPPPPWEGPVLAFVVAVLAAYAVALVGLWGGVAAGIVAQG